MAINIAIIIPYPYRGALETRLVVGGIEILLLLFFVEYVGALSFSSLHLRFVVNGLSFELA